MVSGLFTAANPHPKRATSAWSFLQRATAPGFHSSERYTLPLAHDISGFCAWLTVLSGRFSFYCLILIESGHYVCEADAVDF